MDKKNKSKDREFKELNSRNKSSLDSTNNNELENLINELMNRKKFRDEYLKLSKYM